MNDDELLAVIFGVAVGCTLLIGAGMGLFVNWLLG